MPKMRLSHELVLKLPSEWAMSGNGTVQSMYTATALRRAVRKLARKSRFRISSKSLFVSFIA
jgi:hypothetical protein